jgi:hypothetical protein
LFSIRKFDRLLFAGGTSDGVISAWDIGLPSLPSYDGVNPTKILRLFPDYGDVYNVAWTGDNRWLLAGTAAGLVGYHIDDDKIEAKIKDSAADYRQVLSFKIVLYLKFFDNFVSFF